MRVIADTSVFIARESGRPLDAAAATYEFGVSNITVGELRLGVLAASDSTTRARRLTTLTEALALEPIPVDDRVAEAWSELRMILRESSQRMPPSDSWIAATAMALRVPVATQDDDYDVEIPGLSVVRV
jgi:predicted nucleic acid-binding protein